MFKKCIIVQVMNGVGMENHGGPPIPPQHQLQNQQQQQLQQQLRPRNFKLLSDPTLVKGVTKVVRYDGIVPNDSTYPPVIPRDPRNPVARIRQRMEPLVLSVPR